MSSTNATFSAVSLAACSAVLAAPAAADVVIDSASHSIYVGYGIDGQVEAQQDSFNGVGGWSQSATMFSPNGMVGGMAQHSSFAGTTGISHSAELFSQAGPFSFHDEILGSATSSLLVHFTVTQAIEFEFEHSWSSVGNGQWWALAAPYVALYRKDGPGSGVFEVSMPVNLSGDPQDDSGAISGVLQPGQYALESFYFVHPGSGLNYGNASSSYELTAEVQLTFIPAPGALALIGIGALATRRRRRSEHGCE